MLKPKAKKTKHRIHLSHSLSNTNRENVSFLPCMQTPKKMHKYNHYSHLKRADFNCLFILLRLIILETNLSACLQMAELRIILIHTHTHWLHTYLPLSHTFSTPTLITASAHRPQNTHTCECIFAICLSCFFYSIYSCYRCGNPQETTGVIDWFVFLIRAN